MHRSHKINLADYVSAVLGYRALRCHACYYRYRVRGVSRKTYLWTQCPKCFSTEVNRIERDKVFINGRNFWWTFLHAPGYRCSKCRTRYFDFRPAKHSAVSS
ncbi:MAG: hypothetical protein A3F68_02400 [Acidobacteria bacterium RIFCSPLOWO2_12_FULL_54_10]|nr:MAG: hypothetical protein A3F68_02400 [Acidobacteria bacterium RIFCSPLOWO2_12_FULL_54_10]